jgi:hypothetical protein
MRPRSQEYPVRRGFMADPNHLQVSAFNSSPDCLDLYQPIRSDGGQQLTQV